MSQKKSKKRQARKSPAANKIVKKKSFQFNSDYIFIGILVLAVILIAVIRSNFLDMPFERDEGDYALAGKLILQGAIPYVDVFEQKPPGLFYSYAVIEAIFGTSIKGLHLGFIFVNIFTVVFLSLSLRNLMSPVAGAIGGVAFAILSQNPNASGFTVQAEHVLCLFVCASLFFLTVSYQRDKLWPLIVSGALVAWATTIKQNGLFFIIAIVLGVFALHISKQKIDFKKLFKEYIYLAIGGVGVAILVCLLMIIQGVWDEFIFWAITFPRERYVSSITAAQGQEYFNETFVRIRGFNLWLWISAGLGIVALFFNKIKLGTKIWLLLFVILSCVSIVPGLRFYGHYWLHLFIGIAIAVAALFHTVQELLTKKFSKIISLAVPLLVFVIFLINGLNKNKNYYFNPNKPAILRSIYGDNPFIETDAISKFLKSKNPTKDDKLVVLGSEPQLHFDTGMESPTPFTFITFVASNHPASTAWRQEYMEMLRKNEAKYAVMVFHPYSWLAKPGESNAFFQDSWKHLQRNYKRIGIADMQASGNTVYKWNNDAASYKPTGSKYLIVYERN